MPVLDERGAGFAAVGLARTGALPAVIVTSGTAVAELTPAAASSWCEAPRLRPASVALLEDEANP